MFSPSIPHAKWSVPKSARTPSTSSPRFQTTLQDRTVFYRGRRSELAVIVHGTPQPTVKWMVNNTLLRDSERIHMYTSHNGHHRLVLDDVNDSDAGIYTVFAFNAIDETIADTHVNVEVGPPLVSTLFSSLDLKLDERMCLVVSVKDYGSDYQVTWFKNGLPISKSNEGILMTKKAHMCALKINSVTLEDSGQYKCVIRAIKETSMQFVVKVTDPDVKASPCKYNNEITHNGVTNSHLSLANRSWNNVEPMCNLDHCIPLTTFLKESRHLHRTSLNSKLNKSKSISDISDRMNDDKERNGTSMYFKERLVVSSKLRGRRSTSLEDLLGLNYARTSRHGLSNDYAIGSSSNRKEINVNDGVNKSLLDSVRFSLEKAKGAIRIKDKTTTPPVLVRYAKTAYA